MKKCIRLGKLCNDNKSRHVKMNKVTINFKTIPNYIEELNRILERKEMNVPIGFIQMNQILFITKNR